MERAMEMDFTDIIVTDNSELENSGPRETLNYKELALCVSTNQIMQDVLQLATARLCAAGDRGGRSLRREGDILPLHSEALVGEALRSGDRLILEVAVRTDRIGAGRTQSVEEEDGFTAATREAGRAMSANPRAFLHGVRDTHGE